MLGMPLSSSSRRSCNKLLSVSQPSNVDARILGCLAPVLKSRSSRSRRLNRLFLTNLTRTSQRIWVKQVSRLGLRMTRVSTFRGTRWPRLCICMSPKASPNVTLQVNAFLVHPSSVLAFTKQCSGDRHDKLYSIGFPIWAVADVASKSMLGAWVLPSNRDGTTIGYLFLTLVLKYKGTSHLFFFFLLFKHRLPLGLPIQFGSDCGSETTQLFGLVQALR